MGAPLYVLLDQNHWIYLAKAYHGKPHRPAHQFLVDPLIAAVESDSIRLPLSATHLIELLRAESPARRGRLAEVLERFGRGWFMAAWADILPAEIHRAVASIVEQRKAAPLPNVFGRGFLHGFSAVLREELCRFSPPELLGHLERLAALPGALLDLIAFPNEGGRNNQNIAIAGLNRGDAASIELSRQAFQSKSKAVHRSAKVSEYTYLFQDQIAVALSPTSLSFQDFLSRGVKFLAQFWSQVPSIHIDCELTLYRDRQWSRPIDPNDFSDLGHLVLGLPYCSVVLVERFWARALAETNLANEYGTSVYTDLEDLQAIVETSLIGSGSA